MSSLGTSTGPATGGTSVVITGTNFTGATAVKFGLSNASGFTVNSATQITATAPSGSGTVDITVVTGGGT
ncbi:IPT/TIG domain-containing protein, partial [Cryobacterium sp. RTS3]|uniref:IPT/TIG domain-containing protein n=1 Tax=Cryobacterium sp. RTS3 TaxID=3048643 RepID=UPI0034DD16C0